MEFLLSESEVSPLNLTADVGEVDAQDEDVQDDAQDEEVQDEEVQDGEAQEEPEDIPAEGLNLPDLISGVYYWADRVEDSFEFLRDAIESEGLEEAVANYGSAPIYVATVPAWGTDEAVVEALESKGYTVSEDGRIDINPQAVLHARNEAALGTTGPRLGEIEDRGQSAHGPLTPALTPALTPFDIYEATYNALARLEGRPYLHVKMTQLGPAYAEIYDALDALRQAHE